MKVLDTTIALHLEEAHRKQEGRINKTRLGRPPFEVGDREWLLKAKTHASVAKLEPRWFGPMLVIQRTSQSCYEARDQYGEVHAAHMDQLKPYVSDIEEDGLGNILEFKRKMDKKGQGPIRLGEIKDHRSGIDGSWEFLIHWRGDDPSEGAWESPEIFVRSGLLHALWEYCNHQQIPISIPDLLPSGGGQ